MTICTNDIHVVENEGNILIELLWTSLALRVMPPIVNAPVNLLHANFNF